ncbi:MAG: gluconokinase [Candidatus Rokubacteria bacterium]|nr:gluconokinase [Candidatus Rokubacteria bacterium]
MVIALDIGSSSARAALYDDAGRPATGRFHRVVYESTVTPDGGVEHDPVRLLAAAAECVDGVLVGARPGEVRAVGVTTFWHGLLGFDAGGDPVTPVLMWADTRSTPDARLLRGALDESALHARTGCHLHSSYWPAKLRWLARARPRVVRRVARWGSIGEHLALSLFGEATTSVSMASGTGLLDQEAIRWDPEALAAAGIGEEQLFRLVDRTDAQHGLRPQWARRWAPLRGVGWFPAVGDGAAGNVGSDCTDRTRVALNVGTSAALRVITEDPTAPPRGLWRYRVDRRRAMVGGATSEGGNVRAWCRQVLRLPPDAELEAALAALPAAGHGLTVLPHLAGERAPGWRGDRHGVIAGLRLDTTALEIVRAALEAVALRLALVHELLAPRAAADHAIIASGGALAGSRVFTQIVADALGRPVTWSPEPEATSRGAALLALDALGALPERGAPRTGLGETFAPDAARHARYREALARQARLDAEV